MQKPSFLPHVVVFGVAIVVVLFGIATNSGKIGGLIGGVLAAFTDLPTTIVTLGVGAVITRQVILFPALLLLSAVFTVVIAQMNAELGAQLSWFVFSVRAISVVLLGYAANFVRTFFDRRKAGESS